MTTTQNSSNSNSSRQNKNFTQIYPEGFDQIDNLISTYPLAARIYTFIAKHCDKRGALVISQELLAKQLSCSSRSIRSATKYLADNMIVPRLKVGGNTYIYSIRPEEFWKAYDNQKEYAIFNTIVYIDKEKNEDVIRQIKAMYKF